MADDQILQQASTMLFSNFICSTFVIPLSPILFTFYCSYLELQWYSRALLSSIHSLTVRQFCRSGSVEVRIKMPNPEDYLDDLCLPSFDLVVEGRKFKDLLYSIKEFMNQTYLFRKRSFKRAEAILAEMLMSMLMLLLGLFSMPINLYIFSFYLNSVVRMALKKALRSRTQFLLIMFCMILVESSYFMYLSRFLGPATGDLEGRACCVFRLGVSMMRSIRWMYLCVFQSIPRFIKNLLQRISLSIQISIIKRKQRRSIADGITQMTLETIFLSDYLSSYKNCSTS